MYLISILANYLRMDLVCASVGERFERIPNVHLSYFPKLEIQLIRPHSMRPLQPPWDVCMQIPRQLTLTLQPLALASNNGWNTISNSK
jgi:hypothetical protein